MPDVTTPTLTTASDATPWPDFYALLNAPDDADAPTLNRRMAACYAQARANWEHPDAQQRTHFRYLVNQVLSDCRLILLDEQRRAEYDWYLAYHRAGDPSAPDYAEFAARLRAVSPVKVIASRENAVPRLAAQSPRVVVEEDDARHSGKTTLRRAGASLLRQVHWPRHA